MTEVSPFSATENQPSADYTNGDSDYGSQENGMEVENGTNNLKEEVNDVDDFDAALVAATQVPKKENAPPKEELSDDDDIPWAARMNKDNGKSASTPKNSEKKKKPHSDKKKRKHDSDSEEEYKPEVGGESDDDMPWAARIEKENGASIKKETIKTSHSSSEETPKKKKDKKKKRKEESDSDDDGYKPPKKDKKKKRKEESDSDDDGYKPPKKKEKKDKKKEKESSKKDKSSTKKPATASPTKKKKKEEEPDDVWEWWKEEKKPDGVKWNSLSHMGPLFAPPYVPIPDHVHFKYEGKTMKLSPEAEETATFYGRMLDHEYTSKEQFNRNFFRDWRKTMTSKEREIITDLSKCDFRQIDTYYKAETEKRKAMTKDEKNKIKESKEEEVKIYGFAYIDGHKQKVANFRIEPPGLFRGRGGHPKMGMLKKRILPEDVVINCGRGTDIPKAPEGHRWKEVRHDNSVSWLCSWSENVLGSNKYIMLNPSSKMKGEKDHQKYETARRLKKRIDGIREVYVNDWKSKEMRVRQRAVALYFIDKLALRAGNEKDVDEAADTVGCCSLRCEHIKLFDELDGKENVVQFDFLGKDSIRYFNQVPVEKRAFKNLKLFMENKSGEDDLFDRLDTQSLNEHLRSLMDNLTVKVFRTYNASITLQDQLELLTPADGTVQEKMLAYNRANRQVAILCNHQRAVPKTHEKSMDNIEMKIKKKKEEVREAKDELERAKGSGALAKDKAKKKYERLKEQLKKLKIQRTDKDENKQIALGTSKLNYLDPRISIAWCKKHDVPVEKVFNKTQREKFRWAIDMTMTSDEEYIF